MNRALRRLVVHPVDAQESTRVTIGLLGLYGFVAGLSGIITDISQAPSYSVIMSVPGGISPWSVAVLVNSVGILLALALSSKKVLAAMLAFGGIWTLGLGIGFVAAYIDDPEGSSVLAFASLLLISMFHSQKAWMMWSSRNVHLVYVEDMRHFDRGDEDGDCRASEQ